MKETYASLKRLTKGTNIKIERIKGTDNIYIKKEGYVQIHKQIGGNVGISATEIIKSMKIIDKRNLKWKRRDIRSLR